MLDPALALTSSAPSPDAATAGLRTAPAGLHGRAHPGTVSEPAVSASEPLTGDVRSVFALAADDLVAAEAQLAGMLDSVVPAVNEIGRHLVDAGGKRLRPLLTALGARAVGVEGDISRLMCVGELLHVGSLLHDDVVDDGHERRGRPAAQRIYGNPAAVLTGDFCLARSVVLAAEEGGARAVTELGHTVTAMSEGELVQLLNAGNLDLDLATYMDVVDKKSAALISWCAAAGAWKVGDDVAAAALQRYGHEVGIAFQITDDVLDYVGEMRLTGKRRGQDLAERKLTLPLVIAFQRVPELRGKLAKGAPSPERIPAIIADVRSSGACDEALAVARRRVTDGIAALDVLPPSPWRDGLVTLAGYLVERVR
ncbi:MAG: polyprenyl synthetase family protein [Alphaproteobacteria bacterium]|nr:polyprenyl synthetase family protein [Alphaproteobacteria bacterium]